MTPTATDIPSKPSVDAKVEGTAPFPFRCTADRMDYLVNYSKRHGFVYVETPKVACSTVKRTLQALEVADAAQVLPDPHDRTRSPLLRIRDDAQFIHDLLNGRYLTFCFVRNPFTRVLAAYLDKLVNNAWERERRLPELGFAPDARPTFLEFLESIAQQPPEEMDIHWCPQSTLLSPERVPYDFVGRFENFEADFRRVLIALGFLEPSILTENAHATASGNRVAQCIRGNERNVILQIYAEDFDRFLYSRRSDLA